MGKPLSSQDFAVIDTNLDATDNLQCIWCGMFMDTHSIGMHFHEVHPEEIELPKCNLCLLVSFFSRISIWFLGNHHERSSKGEIWRRI